MKNQASKDIALSVLKAIFSSSDVIRLSKLRGVILCGLPGCGKSTIAELLHDAFGFEVLSTDQVRTKDLFKGQKHRMASEHLRVMLTRYAVYAKLGSMVNRKLNDKVKVVVDGTHLDDKRFSNIGGMLAKLPSKKMAMIVVKTPEWIIKKRFMDLSQQKYNEWWSVYKFWKEYLSVGKAKFPTKKELSNVEIIKPKRYAIRTFDWVTDVKAILWDVDGTFYRPVKAMDQLWEGANYKKAAEKLNISLGEAKARFKRMYREIGSRTKVLDKLGIDGRKHVGQMVNKTKYELFLKKDLRLRKTIRRLKNVDHYIFTNSSMIGTKKKLKVLGISEKYFKKIFTTHDMNMSAKDAKAFRVVLRKVGLKANQVLKVGDREMQDVLPAKKIGIRTCMVWGKSEEADVCLKNVYEVASLFGSEI